MLTLRSRIGVAAVDGLLYAFGGYDGTSRLQTVECYDPKVQINVYFEPCRLCIGIMHGRYNCVNIGTFCSMMNGQ